MATINHDTPDRHPTIGPDAAEPNRYAIVELENGSLIIHGLENENVWIQSSLSVSLADME